MPSRYAAFISFFPAPLLVFATLVFATLVFATLVFATLGSGTQAAAQQDQQNTVHILVNVNLVQLNVAVTDRKGNYVTGLRPEDFSITEDRIPEQLATFAEGNQPTLTLIRNSPSGATASSPSSGQPSSQPSPPVNAAVARRPASNPATSDLNQPQQLGSMVPGANVFILFDTSDYMYRGFVFAQDAIADFVRSLGGASKVALYSYSRNLSRDASLTPDRLEVLRGLRGTVAGADSALYDSLLLTVEDAAKYKGRKIVVVFSNGPDDASLVPPEDVAELAQSTGTIIYMVGTQLAQLQPVSAAAFQRISKVTGGKAYFAKTWRDERRAFASIRQDLQHLYSLSYYPKPNPNQGWRAIQVKLVGQKLQKYHVRTRDGYRLQVALASPGKVLAPGSETVRK